MSDEDDVAVQAIRRKAARMAASRRRPPSFWRQLGNVGVLGWLFVLPLVGFMALTHWLGRRHGIPWLGLVGGAFGLFAGGYGVYRAMRRSLDEEENETAPRERTGVAAPPREDAANETPEDLAKEERS